MRRSVGTNARKQFAKFASGTTPRAPLAANGEPDKRLVNDSVGSVWHAQEKDVVGERAAACANTKDMAALSLQGLSLRMDP